ncbi:hypothetical protein ACFOU2_22215 [Bacillus songklensis]|uniref:Uncharacterized protein n=1 Tax=Bacillus songklensis TaxID=1069116 RepID=A0ABV8B979_9BACI
MTKDDPYLPDMIKKDLKHPEAPEGRKRPSVNESSSADARGKNGQQIDPS